MTSYSVRLDFTHPDIISRKDLKDYADNLCEHLRRDPSITDVEYEILVSTDDGQPLTGRW